MTAEQTIWSEIHAQSIQYTENILCKSVRRKFHIFVGLFIVQYSLGLVLEECGEMPAPDANIHAGIPHSSEQAV